ncbi:MAG: hypothetical protein QOJ27_2698 [Sphingomonadales bacterium]|jgi:hypothetical protein|nr:hypothetical protein [Sphingomonadales bacterium]
MLTPRRLLAFVRKDVLAAVGILGLAINLIGSIGPFLTVANVARYIVDHWVEVTSIVWIELFGLFGLRIPPLLGFSLTLLVFHLGLVGSAYRRARDAEPLAEIERRSWERDRLLALVLYIPIMIGTLLTAFATLARDTVTGEAPAGPPLIILSFFIVVLSPVVAFSLARPRLLVRRFLSVYVVAGLILLLDFGARVLEGAEAGPAKNG